MGLVGSVTQLAECLPSVPEAPGLFSQYPINWVWWSIILTLRW